MNIRQTKKADYAEIYKLIKTAFETAEHSDADEQNFAERLRTSDNYIPELDLTVELDGRLIGHIMFTKTYVTKADGSRYNTLLIAPLSVLIEHRNVGVGSALMNTGVQIAQTLGYESAFLVGDPVYYHKLGYEHSSIHGINHESFPAEYVLVKEFSKGVLNKVKGIINI